jgi:hypothetical protein
VLRDSPGLKWFFGGILAVGLGILIELTLDAIVGVVLIVGGMFVAIAFKSPRDWKSGWPPPWLDEIWNGWIGIARIADRSTQACAYIGRASRIGQHRDDRVATQGIA